MASTLDWCTFMDDKVYAIICVKCGNVYSLRLDDIRKSTVNLDGQDVEVQWFFCDKCGDVQIASVNTPEIAELRESYEAAKKRFRTYIKFNDDKLIENAHVTVKIKHDKLSAKVDEVVGKLRERLVLRYVGCDFYLALKSCHKDLAGGRSDI